MKAKRTLSLSTTLGTGLGVVLLAAGSAFAVVGDIGIYRESTAGDGLTTAAFDHDWDTIERSSSAYNLSGSAIDFTTAGHYLVMYSSRFDSTGGSNRSEVQ